MVSPDTFDPPVTPDEATLVAIGNFDGVHRGHRAVLGRALKRAESEGLRPLVLTFAPHPAQVLGRAAPPALTRSARKAALLRELSPALGVVVQPFDLDFAALSPEAFVRVLLVEKLRAKAVVVGENFRFGNKRVGDFATLRDLGARFGFAVVAEPVVRDTKGALSSSRVRQSLAAGDLDDGNEVLGRPHALEGVVVEGQRRARGLGFPTANLAEVVEALPAYGVYAIEVERLEEEGGPGVAIGKGVANVGVRPTLAAGLAVETHIFDWSGDLYGSRLRVNLHKRLREERTFAGVDDLKAQIALDAAAARLALRR